MRALHTLRTNALDSTLNVSLSVLETRDGLAQLSSVMQSLAEVRSPSLRLRTTFLR